MAIFTFWEIDIELVNRYHFMIFSLLNNFIRIIAAHCIVMSFFENFIRLFFTTVQVAGLEKWSVTTL